LATPLPLPSRKTRPLNVIVWKWPKLTSAKAPPLFGAKGAGEVVV
jgi:hypothetical protein